MSWIAVHAHAERMPLRVELTLTLGELPESWTRANATRTSTKRNYPDSPDEPGPSASKSPDSPDYPRTKVTAILGLILIAPFTAALAAGLLRSIGVHAPLDWIGSAPFAIIAASISLFFGIPIAIALNLWRITRIGLRRQHGELEGLLALELAPLHLLVVVAGLLIGGLFVAHLAADSFACWNGVRSAC